MNKKPDKCWQLQKVVNIFNIPLRSAVGSESWAHGFITNIYIVSSNNATPNPQMHCVDEHLIQQGGTFHVSVSSLNLKKKKKDQQ